MSDVAMLADIVAALGYSSSCSPNNSKTDNKATDGAVTGTGNDDLKKCPRVQSLSYPSLSLSHPPAEVAAGAESPTRVDIQTKASTCMAQPITVEFDGLLLKEQQQLPLRQISRQMLENFLDSFDQLVDARIRQYSKVLSNHGLSLLSASGRADIVEYKLRTLLEIGTNISFGSIAIHFDVVDRNSGPLEDTTNSTVDTLPIVMRVEIDSLQFHGGPSSSSSKDDAYDSDDHKKDDQPRHRSKLTFHAQGQIQGISHMDDRCSSSINGSSSSNANATSCAADSRQSKYFNNFLIQVDCEALLREMMEEAGEVVGTVVELTNQAWANKQASSVPSSASARKDAAISSSASGPTTEATKSAAMPKLGVKTVSEPEFAVHAEKSDDEEDESKDGSLDMAGVRGLKRCSNDASRARTVLSLSARAADEENSSSGISAEKARHIIDYVFDEIEDADSIPLIPSPPPVKKTRIEFHY